MKKLIFLLVAVNTAVSFSQNNPEVVAVDAKQKYVVVNNDPVGTWKMDEQACVVRDAEQLGCGLIKGYSAKGAVLVLIGNAKPIQVGDTTFRLTGGRGLSSTETSVISIAYEDEVPTKRMNFQAGANLSLDIYFPIVQFDYAVTNHVVLGLQPAYLTKSLSGGAGSLTGYGASVVASYYFQSAYRGAYMSVGSGYYSYSATASGTTDSSSSPALTALVGWRERWAFRSNVGVALGARYMPHLTGAVSTVKFQEAYPIALLTVGFEF